MQPERVPHPRTCEDDAAHGGSHAANADNHASNVARLYAHLAPQSLHTLGSLVRALNTDDAAWMDSDGRALVLSDTASVLIVTPDNVHRCARLIAQQARSGGCLRLSATGHWAGMISLFHETADEGLYNGT
ncbi:hypothetical protein pkur_cds_793 [Pandoravirus kuranda]|uniref:Uncharacterized protein n=1 Tax=Pandoravirus kuranda TaxID=3019033 RepID=A0AA95J3X5_9VIRU|nr:hypothetical protein pkur_cds_793 [Pandoravirus kuranda]